MISEKGKLMLNTITEAAILGDLAAIECEDLETGERVEVLCAVTPDPTGEIRVTPLAILSVDPDNPTAGLRPPEGVEIPEGEERLLS